VARHRVKPAGIALLLTVAAGIAIQHGSTAPAGAAQPSPQGRVIVFVLDPVSFEDLLGVPEFRDVARSGGSALMTTHVGEPDDASRPYLVIANGRWSPEAGPPLLNAQLGRHDVSVCLFGAAEARGETRMAFVPDLRASPVAAMALGPDGRASPCSPQVVTDGQSLALVVDVVDILGANAHPRAAGAVVAESLARLSGPRTLALVVVPEPSAAMDRVGDEVTPLLLAFGTGEQLSDPEGPVLAPALTSGTTRQPGLVANVDVAPTILSFFGVSIPARMEGQAIEVTGAPPPFDLHRRHLEHRRIRVPIQLGELAFVIVAGIAGIAALALLAVRGSLPARVSVALRFVALCGVALLIPLSLGGLLPRLTYAVAVPFVILATIGLAALSLSARWPGPTGPFAFLGAVSLATLAIDAAFGWPGGRLPLLGGTMFDGVRFYGLPNAFIAMLLASALFVAGRLDPIQGTLLLAAAGLFAGFPWLGANVGASIALFFAAGLWWVLRTRDRVGLREVAFVAGVVAVGVGVVLLANRYLAGTPTHVTRFAESDTSIGDALGVFGRRLRASVRMLNETIGGYVPLLGLPVVLWLAMTRPGPIGRGLDAAGEGWRHLLIVLVVSGIVVFFVEDTGVAAAGPVFLYAMSALAYPAFLRAHADRE
jgi:hypothetical protein